MVRNLQKVFALLAFSLLVGGCGSPINVVYKGEALLSALGVLSATEFSSGSSLTIHLSKALGVREIVDGQRFADSTTLVTMYYKQGSAIFKGEDGVLNGLVVTAPVPELTDGEYTLILEMGKSRFALNAVNSGTGAISAVKFNFKKNSTGGSTTGGSTTGGSTTGGSTTGGSTTGGSTTGESTTSSSSSTGTTYSSGASTASSSSTSTSSTSSATTATSGSSGGSAPVIAGITDTSNTPGTNSGPVGAYFNMTGSGFVPGGTTYTMNNLAFTCQMVMSGNAYNCTVPNNPPGTWSVVACNGQLCSNAFDFTVTFGGGPPGP